MFDVAIIGAGVIGTFIARELSRYKLNVILLEKDNDVANGTTKANSGIIHAGYDAKPGTKMAEFNAKGNLMFDKICEELDVPFKRTGSLVVAFNDEEMNKIEELYKRGIKNGIPKIEIIDGERIKEMEPNLNGNVKGGLYAPTCGIISPWELAIALAENAVENGVQLMLNNRVLNIEKDKDIFKIFTQDKEIEAKYVINCGGVYADKIYNMIGTPYFKIKPRRGQYYILDKSAGDFVNRVIFQCPTAISKGVLMAPTAHGNMIIGPNAEDIDNREGIDTTAEGLEFVRKSALNISKEIPFREIITTFAGLRAAPSTGDFIIEESKEVKGFINVAGIKSPGLSASPAIAKYVVEIIKEINRGLIEKENFNPRRRPVVRFDKLSEKEKSELIKRDSKYGRIICRCEKITEGEIVNVIKRKVGATTVDGIKKRVRPGMGRCQGGFCQPRVMEILARELGRDMKNIVKDSLHSYILTSKTAKGRSYNASKEFAAASIDK